MEGCAEALRQGATCSHIQETAEALGRLGARKAEGRAQLCGPRQQPGGLVRGSVRGRCGLPPSRQGSHTRPVLCGDRCDSSVGSRLHRARLDWRGQSRGCRLDEVRGDLGGGEQRAACKSSSRGGKLGPSAAKQQDVERGSARLSLR